MSEVQAENSRMVTVSGTATSRGFVSGTVFLYAGDREMALPEYTLPESKIGAELARYREARAETRRQLEGVVTDVSSRVDDAEADIFRNHLVMLEDEVIISSVEKIIREERLNAEAAIHRVADSFRKSFERMNDPYLRERARDLDDVERRIMRTLTGRSETVLSQIDSPVIIVADDLTPSETVTLPRRCILGFATNHGSATSHVALLARAMGIPAVTGLGDITSVVKAGDRILLNGTHGEVTVNPDHATREQFAKLIWRERELMAMLEESRRQPDCGLQVKLLANVQPGVPFGTLAAFGAEGMGLYRSEYLWLNRELEPTEDEQFEAYRSAAMFASRLAEGSSATIRLLDIGGDKIVKGISTKEPNPFLGNRSIRYLLSHRSVMRRQFRAILRASAFGNVRLMYPMVSCVEELRESATELESVKRELESEGVDFDKALPVGAMIEVPSAALNADELARYVRFFSIGTNDLVQYTMAADRGNDAVASLYQPLNPAVIKLVKMAVEAAKRAGIPVGVCGESAADPVVGTYWVALGVTDLSMSATYIPVMAKVLSGLTRADLDEYAKVPDSMPHGSTAQDVFNACHDWIADRLPELRDSLII